MQVLNEPVSSRSVITQAVGQTSAADSVAGVSMPTLATPSVRRVGENVVDQGIRRGLYVLHVNSRLSSPMCNVRDAFYSSRLSILFSPFFSADHVPRAITLDFETGLIRDVMTTDVDGLQWSNDGIHVSQYIVPTTAGILGAYSLFCISFFSRSWVKLMFLEFQCQLVVRVIVVRVKDNVSRTHVHLVCIILCSFVLLIKRLMVPGAHLLNVRSRLTSFTKAEVTCPSCWTTDGYPRRVYFIVVYW